jgi:hypothetical protein
MNFVIRRILLDGLSRIISPDGGTCGIGGKGCDR